MFIGAHLYTQHFNSGYCNNNYGIYVATEDKVVLGILRNSECNIGAYLAWAPENNVLTIKNSKVSVSLTIGGIYGYKNSLISPLIIPSVINEYKDVRYRLSYLPKPPNSNGSAGIHYSIEWRFK